MLVAPGVCTRAGAPRSTPVSVETESTEKRASPSALPDTLLVIRRNYQTAKVAVADYRGNMGTIRISKLVLTPAAPTNLSATAQSASSITVSWTDNADNESGYAIWRSTSETSRFAAIDTVGANATSYTNSGLGAGVTYYYRVRA